VKNRKSDRVGRSSGSAGCIVAPSTAPPPVVAEAMAPVGGLEMARERERTRRWIALAVIGLLAAVIVPGAVGLMRGTLSVGDMKELLGSLGVLITLLGTVQRFYFGERRGSAQ
jgi:hypothetical protein